jgi:hypothetical protein
MSTQWMGFDKEEEYIKEFYSAPDDERQHTILDDLSHQQRTTIPDNPADFICPELIMRSGPAFEPAREDSPQEHQERNL